MLGAFYAYASALLVFGLVSEAHSPFLIWAGGIYAAWLVLAGSIVGYRAARQD
jgi:hypothetical protein